MTDANSPLELPNPLKRDGDPKMIGLWKVGRTIGKGSSGAFSTIIPKSIPRNPQQVESASLDIPRPASMTR